MLTNIQKWFMIVAMWVGILFVAFVFYWMAVRPGQIRRECAAKAQLVSQGSKSSLSSMLEINRAIYADCLKCNGIDK